MGHTRNRTHSSTTQPGRAGHSRDPSAARTPTQHTPARKGREQAGRAHKHTHAPTPQPGVAGRGTNHTPPHSTPNEEVQDTTRDGHASTHTPQHLPKEWRGAAEKQDPGTHAHTAHRNREWRGAGGARTQPHTSHNPNHERWGAGQNPSPTANTANPSRQKRDDTANRTQTPTQDPSQGWRGYRNPHPTTTRTQTQTPHNSRKPSVHSPGTEAAHAMQVTRPNEIRRPGVGLHPKACAALGLEAERAGPKRLGTPVPRTRMHALATGYARKSGEPLGFRLKEGTCASTGAHPPGETSTSRWRPSVLPVLPGAALSGANSQV